MASSWSIKVSKKLLKFNMRDGCIRKVARKRNLNKSLPKAKGFFHLTNG